MYVPTGLWPAEVCCYKQVAMLYSECYKQVATLYSECYKQVATLYSECYKQVATLYSECYKQVPQGHWPTHDEPSRTQFLSSQWNAQKLTSYP